MRSVSYRLADLIKARIPLGFVGENEHTVVQFDAKQAFDQYPTATPSLTVKNPSGEKYPAVVVRDGDMVIWTISDSDLIVPGRGEFQLQFKEGDTVMRSYVGETRIERSIMPTGNVPTPVQNWIDAAEDVLEEVEEAIPAGGTTGQVLAKKTNADRDLEWVDQTGGGGGTTNYDALSNKPQIAGVELSGDKSLHDLGIAAESAIPDVSGFYTKPASGIPASDIADGVIPTVHNVPAGGSVNQVLAKNSGTDYDLKWVNQSGGGGGAEIDDTAGEGDTTVVWSADKTWTENEALKEAIMTKAGTETTTESGVDLDISDENGNVLVELKNGHIKTKYFDSSQSANSTGIVARNKDVTDGVYASCRYHQPSASSKQFCMLMGTDFHGDSTRLASMVEYLNAVDAFDAGICLGDIVGTDWTNSAEYYTTAISETEKPFLTVIGNHDAGYNALTTGYTDIADLVAKFITPNIQYADLANGEYPSGKSYYYKDFATYGIRLIVLNNYEYPSDNDGTNFLYHRGYNCWSQDQVDWFISTLNNTPTTYGVIIAAHFVPTSTSFDRTNPWTSSTMSYGSWTPDTCLQSTDKNMMAEIVDAWIDGTTLSKSYTYDVSGGSWSGITVSADFTSRGAGEFIAWIGGHLHMSLLGYIYSYSDQPVYLVDCSGLGASLQGDTPRKQGTRSEDALCVLSVDRTLKTVKLFRIGAHFTMDAVDRLYGKFSYGGE